MRWEYRSPREKLFISDGKDAWFYLPQEKQARKTAVKKLDDLRSPIAFLLGKTKLEKELQGLGVAAEKPPSEPGNTLLRGVPKGMAESVSEVLIEVTPQNAIRGMTIAQPDGSVTEFRFQNERGDVALGDQPFQFSPPPGVEVMSAEFGQ
jgi:outer membrane lipoprotein-sorting protein